MTNNDFSYEPKEGYVEYRYIHWKYNKETGGESSRYVDEKIWIRGGEINFYKFLNHWNRAPYDNIYIHKYWKA